MGAMVVCDYCGNGGLLDEHARCEGCVRDLERRAIGLQELEEAVAGALERGLTTDQLREAFELSLSARAGAVADGSIARRPVATHERGIWDVCPESAFLEYRPPAFSLGSLRRSSGLTLQELADKLGTDPETVALWEAGAPIPEPTLERLADLFCVKPSFFFVGPED